MSVASQPLLEVDGLNVSFSIDGQRLRAVRDVSFQLQPGEILGIVGESGCGKSVTAQSLMRLLPQPSGSIDAGKVLLQGKDLVTLPDEQMRKVRGDRMAIIFQEPMTALNPVYRISRQMEEMLVLHRPQMSPQERRQRIVAALHEVGIPAAEKRVDDYLHQLSGGMRQRVMIAMALLCEPEVLIADEPTTALDVTTQAQILDILRQLQRQRSMGVIFITHDLGVIAELCDRVLVMYGGRVVEEAPVKDIFYSPRHPYTRGLISSVPSSKQPRKSVLSTIPGTVPTLAEMPAACSFVGRCTSTVAECHESFPSGDTAVATRRLYCHNPEIPGEEEPS